MLRWLPSALYSRSTERKLFLKDIFLFVLAAHLLFLIVMVGASMFGRNNDSFTISMHQTGATYVLMPLDKKMVQSSKNNISHQSGAGNAIKASRVVSYQEYQRRKQGTKSTVAQKQGSAKKASSISAKKERAPTVSPPKRPTAAFVDNVKVSNKFKKNQVVSNKANNKVALLEVAPSSTVEATMTQEVVPQETVVVPAMVVSQESQENTELLSEDNVVFVGYEQLDECLVGSKIQHAIAQSWTPPVGIACGTSCQMRVTVSDQGVANNVMIEKGSGVLVYDTSARTALLHVEYPKQVWNKTITIVLAN